MDEYELMLTHCPSYHGKDHGSFRLKIRAESFEAAQFFGRRLADSLVGKRDHFDLIGVQVLESTR